MSYFAPENINTGIFLCMLDNENELKSAIELLRQHSIVDLKEKETILSVNKLVQKIIRENLEKQENEEEILKKALKLFYVNGINSNSLNHAMTVWSYASKYHELVKESSRIPSSIVNELRICVRYEEANEFGRKALDLLNRTIGDSHPDTLTLQHHLGSLLGVQGKYNEALEILLPLYKKDKEISGQREVLETLFTIARQLSELSVYDEALAIYEKVFYGQKVSKTNDISSLTAWHDYALLLSDLGNLYESFEILRDVFKKRSEILGAENESTVSVKSSIGNIFLKQGKYRKALEAYQEVYEKRMSVLGEKHIDTIRIRDDIALVYLSQKKYDEALEIYEEVTKQFEYILGKEHPDTLASRANLASTYNEKGEFRKALEIYKDVSKKQSEMLGPEHYETLRVKRNIALIFFNRGQHSEALRTFKQIYRGYNRLFGPLHPETVEIGMSTQMLSMMPLESTHSVARDGNLIKIISFIQNGADINEKDGNENTPLHYAVQHNHIRVIRFLLESGAIYNTRNKDFKKPLQLTTDSRIKHLFNTVEKLFTDVKAGSHKPVAELIMKHNKIINVKEDGGCSALHWAVSNSHSDVVKLLLENGADATQVTDKANNSLHIAVCKGDKEIIEVLINHVSPDKLNDFINAKTVVGGTTPLHVAVSNGSLDITVLLLKRGAIYDIKNSNDKTPFDLCKDQNVIDLLKLFEELFSDARNGNIDVITKLKAIKPDEFIALTNGRNKEGSTLLQVALTNGHGNIASKLSEIIKHPRQHLQDTNLETQLESLKL